MTNIETRMDSFEERAGRIIVDNVQEWKDDIIHSIKGEVK